MNTYTLITGATSGIGLALAYEYARHGHNVLLVARRKAELEDICTDIRARYNVDAQCYAADLCSAEERENLWQWIQEHSLHISVLMNNAGFGNIGEFRTQDSEHNLAMITLNCTALTHLTHLVLPGMLERKQGNIVNIASVAAFVPGPLQAVYFATKAYVKSFSEALGYELRGSGVYVTTICPGTVSTEFAKAANITNDKEFTRGQTPEAVARVTYKAMKSHRATVFTRKDLAFLIGTVLKFLPKSVQLRMIYSTQKRWMK